MASLLAKFRIDYSDLTVIPDITKKPQEKTTIFFEQLIRDLKVNEEDNSDGFNAEEGNGSKLSCSDSIPGVPS